MKKQILALVLLVSVFSGINAAKAETVAFSLTSEPWEQCTPEELMVGCKKEVMPMMSRVQQFTVEPRRGVAVELMDRNCEGQVSIGTQQGPQYILQPSAIISESGQYFIINNSPNTCQVRMQIQ